MTELHRVPANMVQHNWRDFWSRIHGNRSTICRHIVLRRKKSVLQSVLQTPPTFNPLPSGIRSALEPDSKLFRRPSHFRENNSTTFWVFQKRPPRGPAFNLKPAQELGRCHGVDWGDMSTPILSEVVMRLMQIGW